MVDRSSVASLQLDQKQLLEVVEHTFLLHAGHVSLGHSLTFGSELQNFFISLGDFKLNILLVTFNSAASLTRTLKVFGLFAQSHHL